MINLSVKISIIKLRLGFKVQQMSAFFQEFIEMTTLGKL